MDAGPSGSLGVWNCRSDNTGTGTTSVTATQTTALIGPTQTDTVFDCEKFHTVEDATIVP
jgi:hypothetical protein